MKRAIISIGLAMVLIYVVPYLRPRLSEAKGGVKCPNGYNYRIPESWPTGGKYIHCEDFNKFHELLGEGRITEAEALAFTDRE